MPTNPSQIVFAESKGSPLGRLGPCELNHSKGDGASDTPEVASTYICILIVDGKGEYYEPIGLKEPLREGSAVLVCPQHRFCCRPSGPWSVIRLPFDGPIFDTWTGAGVLSRLKPVLHLDGVQPWKGRITDLGKETSTLSQLCAFQTLLAEMFDSHSSRRKTGGDWLEIARERLVENLVHEIDPKSVAASLNQPYETFRKRFKAAVGVSPAAYRANARISFACNLLLSTHLSHAEIAERLGYANEYYFSTAFKKNTGQTPKAFRKRSAENRPF